ncbi:glycosyltransferase family 25 protein [Microbulbifer sp. SSSA008]|uniref:glycosyltransferase family 25 protein n=1 Tax=Microbulbifer sp. SSSA008 TaxID=3243380 RepID=UPI00403937C4
MGQEIDCALKKSRWNLGALVLECSEATVEYSNPIFSKVLLSHPELAKTNHIFTSVLCGAMAFSNSSEYQSAIDDLNIEVISLLNSPRRNLFSSSWNSKLTFSFFNGVDARVPNFGLTSFPEYRGHLDQGATSVDLAHFGCSVSHFRLWEKMYNQSNIQYFLLLEDDAFLLPFAEGLLASLVRNIPQNADIVFVNGRAAEKLYCHVGMTPPYSSLPDKLFYSRDEVVVNMKAYRELLRVNPSNKKPVLYNGCDGYLITKKGLKKLTDFISKYGLPPLTPNGVGTNVDNLLALLSTGSKHDDGTPLGFNGVKAAEIGIYPTEPYLNAYVSCFPVVEVRERYGIGIGSDINGTTGK